MKGALAESEDTDGEAGDDSETRYSTCEMTERGGKEGNSLGGVGWG